MNEKTKRQLLVGAIVLSVLPAFLLLKFPTNLDITSLSLWLSGVLGYAGIVLLLWMYILGAKSVMGLIFKDLASVLRIHKWLGRWGSLAILAHPLLITLSYGESLLYPILPHIGTQFERHVTLGRIAIYILLLTWVVSWFFKKRLSFRFWKYLHLLAYICLPFAILHVPDTGSQLMAHNSVKVYFLTLVLTFVVFSIIRLRGFLNLDKKPYVVLEQTHIQNGDYLLRLKPLGRPLRPNRGQYVYLKLGLISEDYPFSVLEYSEDSGELRIAYRVYGAYTKELTLLRVNDKVFVGGPYGDFLSDIPDSDRPTVYISGGIGITPFVDHIMHNDIQHEQWLFAANRSPDTALFLSDVAPHLKNRLVSVYETGTKSAKNVEIGMMNGALLKRYLNEPRRYNFYLCGPPPMTKAVRTDLIEKLGVSEDQIFTEKFGW